MEDNIAATFVDCEHAHVGAFSHERVHRCGDSGSCALVTSYDFDQLLGCQFSRGSRAVVTCEICVRSFLATLSPPPDKPNIKRK